MSIGILGGTFDPVHNGHLSIAEDAMRQLGLTGVIFIPAGQPWLKGQRSIAPALHRVEMINLAIDNKSYFSLSTIEIDRNGPTYTVETMETLREKLGSHRKIYFLMGADAVAGITLWKEPDRLIKLCTIAVFARPGSQIPDMIALDRIVPGISRKTVLFEIDPIDISSTEIRQRLTMCLSVQGLVPVAVERYIHQHGLYR